PEGNITRAEVTKMICVALNGGKNPAVSTNTTPTFSDVRNNANAAWAEGYIESCAAQGIVSGVGGGKFNPAGNVTGVQLAKMLLVSLGYKSENEGFTGNSWATNVNVRAAQKGLYEGLESMDTNAAITRDNAAQMVWNALNAYEVEYKTTLVTDSKGQLTSQITVQDKLVQGIDGFVKMTLLEDKYEAVTVKGILDVVKFNDNDNTYNTQLDLIAPYDNSDYGYEDAFDADKDYSDLMGQQVKAMYTIDKKSKDVTLLGIYASDKNKTVTALGTDMDYSKTNTVEIDNKDYKLSDSLKVFAPNGDEIAAQKILAGTNVTATPYYQYTLIDNNNDKTYECAIVKPFSVAQIDYLSSSKVTLSAKGGTTLTKPSFDLKDDDVTLYKDAAEDDYVVVIDKDYTVSGNTEITKASIVSGKVDGTKGTTNATDVKVDGTWYSVAAPGSTGDPIKLNNSYDFAVVNGYVFNAEKTKGNISAENILYVEKSGALSGGIADGVQAKVWFTDGTTKTVTVTSIIAAPGMTVGTNNTPLTVGDSYDVVNTPIYTNHEISNADAAGFITDSNSKYTKLFTYSEKNGEYTLEPVYKDATDDNIGSYDSYVSKDSTTIDDGKTTEKVRFADDGVIFVKDNDGVKVLKGKTVTGWSKTQNVGVYGAADKTNGTQYIAVGLIYMPNDIASSDARNYGFITSDVSTTKISNKEYLTFDMWNGTETVKDIIIEKQGAPSFAKYSFVAFNWSNEETKEASKTHFEVKNATTNAVAITSFVTDDSITFSDSTSKDFTDTYFVIGVDTNAGEGSVAKLATAKEKPDNKNVLSANAVYFTNTAGDKIEAVFVDVSGVMTNNKNGNELYVAGPQTSTSATSLDAIKKLSDGVYVPTKKYATDMAGEAKDNVIFKFTTTTTSENYTLSIKNPAGKEVYTEAHSLDKGAHCFYITTNPLTANVSGTLKETWGASATKAPAGTYSFSITGATSGVVLKGVFTIAANQ
ncbi:S-layer homology domain-containing protein, partial [Evtepia sp.]|uniref:S-layer homology domain-containing protein n=1 Tax=Evtepia sp. TaxID=2773933 RepID=UPI002E79A453